MNITMKDVAKAAGVSLGTVSNVLNKLATVSDKNRIQVMDAVKTLNYKPNYTARALKTKRSKSIGLIIPDIGNPFYPEFARGVEDGAQAAGYNLFLCNSDRSEEKEKEYLLVLLEKMVDGLILYKPHLTLQELEVYRQRCRIVLVDMGLQTGCRCDVVNVDDYLGVRQALLFLWEKGHRQIAMVAGELDSQSSRDRVRAFEDFHRDKQSVITEDYIQHGHYDWHSGFTSTNRLLDCGKPPTAILTANDLMAIGALKAAHERGLSVPGDLSVMGYDDINMASICMPPLTTVRQPKYEMGALSFQALLKRLGEQSHIDSEGTVITLKTEIIERGSVACCCDAKL